jgi:hypothetical protein
MNTMKLSAVVLFGAVCVVGLATAQTPPAPAASPLAPIYACADKTNPTERLACYDAAVGRIKEAEAKSEIVTLDRGRVEQVRREAFGFRMPSLPKLALPMFGGSSNQTSAPAADADIEEQNFAVARVGRSGDRVVIYLDNGQTWRLVESEELNAPRPPFNVKIRSAAMGSYLLTVQGRNKGYRVRRVE